MKKGYSPKSDKRSLMLKTLMDKGMSIHTIYEMTKIFRGRPADENEQITKELSEKAEQDKNIVGNETPAIYSDEKSRTIKAYMEHKHSGLFVDQRTGTESSVTLKGREKNNAETITSIAINEFQQHLNALLTISEDKRTELGQIINRFTEKAIQNGEITEKNRTDFLDRLYEEGIITALLENNCSNCREAVKSGLIYVDESTKDAFGDDWKSFYRRAFIAGIYLTNDRNAYPVDEWTKELGESLPGLFESEELDGKIALERIVQIAEDGKDEKMSFADYTTMIADEYHIPESDLLDEVERKLDIEIQKFAEKAYIKYIEKADIKYNDKAFCVRAREKAERHEMVERQRERKMLSMYQKKVQRELQCLSKNKKTGPEEQKAMVDDVLGDLDILAIGAAKEFRWNRWYNATWMDLPEMYETAKVNVQDFIPSNDLEKICNRINITDADLTVSKLYDIFNATVSLRCELEARNKEVLEKKKSF